MSSISISVIIPTRNRPSDLRRCVHSVQSEVFELIIIDDASDQVEVGSLREVCSDDCDFIYLKNIEKQGACYARNRGAAIARGEWLCFLDDDDQFEGSYLVSMRRLIERNPSVRAWIPDCVGARLRRSGDVQDGDLRRSNRVGGVSGFFVKKSLFMEVGGFDESFYSMQDWDLWMRLQAIGELKYSGIRGVCYSFESSNKITHDLSAKYFGLRRLYFKHRKLWSQHERQYHLIRSWALRQLIGYTATRSFVLWSRLCRWPMAVVYYYKWKRYRK